MILVVGATGTNGREVATRVAQAGKQVRALVRNPAKAADLRFPNIEFVQGDLDDQSSLDRALEGVQRAFIVTPVEERSSRWFGSFFEAAKRAGTPHVVKFSAMGAGDPDSELLRRHGETDQLLRDSGIPYTILQPNSFYQNMFLSAETIKDQGAFYLPMKNGMQSLVDVRDIAAVAVEVLTGAGHEGQTYRITGPKSLSYYDIAGVLSRVLGKPVKYVDVPPEAAKDAMLRAGMSPWSATAVMELFGVFASGRYADTTDTVARITGRPPITFEQFARDFAGVFR